MCLHSKEGTAQDQWDIPGDLKLIGFPAGSVIKKPPVNAGDMGSIPGLGRSPEAGVATVPSILTWKIPEETEESGRPQSIGSHRIRHDWAWPHTLKLKILIWSSPESINVYSKILSLWTSKRIGYTRSKSLLPIFRKKWWYKWYSLLYNNPLDSYFKVLPAGQILARKDNLLSCFYCIAVQGKIWIWKMSNITDCQ